MQGWGVVGQAVTVWRSSGQTEATNRYIFLFGAGLGAMAGFYGKV